MDPQAHKLIRNSEPTVLLLHTVALWRQTRRSYNGAACFNGAILKANGAEVQSMISPEKDIENRRVVWRALADLFLDTELQDPHISAIALLLAESTYSLDEIEDILYREVYPVCIANLRSVAGEWAGFDDQWLEESILEHAKRTGTIRNVVDPNRGMIREYWTRIITAYADLN